NKRVNNLKSSTGRNFVPFYTHNNAGEDSYTLYFDTRTKDIVKAGAKDISPSKLTLLILLGYPIVQYFPVGIIPLNNIIAFISVCILVMVISVLFGYRLSLRMIKDVRKVTLSEEKWNEYLEKRSEEHTSELQSRFDLVYFLSFPTRRSCDLLILLGYPIVQYFPVGIIPLNNIIAFISVCILVMVISVLFGYQLSLRMIKDVRKVTLSEEKWNEYLEKGNKFYFRQLIFLLLLFLFAITCFVFLYIYPSSWWFFGGILSCITAGPD